MKLGELSFEAETGVLLREDGSFVELPPRATSVLKLLADADGAVLSKDEILTSVWSDTVTSEDSLFPRFGAHWETSGGES